MAHNLENNYMEEAEGSRGREGAAWSRRREGATRSSSLDQVTMACMVVFLISGGGGVVRVEAKVAATWLYYSDQAVVAWSRLRAMRGGAVRA
jgi:hypothetical protein